jgi:hypothetical protein
MELLFNIWLSIAVVAMGFSLFIAALGAADMRHQDSPSKEGRRMLRNFILVGLFGWLWPLVIPVLAGWVLKQGAVLAKDAYVLAFGRETVTTDEKPVQFQKPTGAELRRQQEQSRKAHAERLAWKEARRAAYNGYKPATDDEQFIEMMRGHR